MSETFLAIERFIDPTDQQPIEAGLTYVRDTADVYRMFPSRFRRLTRQSGSRIHGGRRGATAARDATTLAQVFAKDTQMNPPARTASQPA